MKVDLAVVVFGWERALGTADHLLSKVSELILGGRVSEEEIFGWQLAPDMFPLRMQVQAVCNLTSQWAAHAVGAEVPKPAQDDPNLEQLREIIADARQFIASLRPEQFDGRDEVELTVNLAVIEPTMPIGRWVIGFATMNILFHLSMAYAILRSRGVGLGKVDLFAGGL